jgi:hypothetical protein
MLTKQTYLTQPGPGIKRPVLYFQGKNQLESQSARDPHAVKQRSAGTAGDQENPEDICRGSQHQLRNKSSWLNQELLQRQLQTTPGDNPLQENHLTAKVTLLGENVHPPDHTSRFCNKPLY